MSYGEKIRKLRERFGLSQSELAQKLGVHKQMISDVERGKQKRFNPQIEKKLIELFDLDPDWFLKEEQPSSNIGSGTEHQESEDELLRAHELMLLHYFRQIPSQKRLDAMACLLECLARFRS